LASFFKKIGLNIDVSDALSLSKSLTQLKNEPKSEDKLNVVNRKFLTNLQQAKYVTIDNHDQEDLIHYGLNFSLYTHFTSPIRRYADLLVHRLLTISLKEKEHTRDKLDGLDYSEYAEDISEKSYNARKASKDC
jgi:DIS3-like exonuclease 2